MPRKKAQPQAAPVPTPEPSAPTWTDGLVLLSGRAGCEWHQVGDYAVQAHDEADAAWFVRQHEESAA